MCLECGQQTYARVRYRRLLTSVERHLERTLGTKVTEGPIDGRYGEARFVSHMSKPGVLQYQITLLGWIRKRATLDFIWRETSAAVVAQRLIDAHEKLRRSVAA